MKRTVPSARIVRCGFLAPSMCEAPGRGLILALTSAPVKTATTPGIAGAAEVSMLLMRALAYWLRTNSACSMPVGDKVPNIRRRRQSSSADLQPASPRIR